MDMEIIREDKDDITLCKIDGKFDAIAAPEAEKVISKIISDGAKKIIMNMEKVGYISSSGLRALLVAAKDIKAQKGKIIICSMTESVNKVFEISGFSTIFETYDTEMDAMKHF
jgi:anti-anti-sigma factor